MKKLSSILIASLTFMLLTESAHSQDQKTQKKDLVQLTVDQQWKRSIWLFDSIQIAAIRHAKSLGETAEDYGKFVGELFAPSWEGVTSPWGMIRGMHRNYQLWPDFEMEITKESENAVTARFNRPYINRFGDDGTSYDVSLSEYEMTFKVFHKTVASHLGFDYKQLLDGDWHVITISRKK